MLQPVQLVLATAGTAALQSGIEARPEQQPAYSNADEAMTSATKRAASSHSDSSSALETNSGERDATQVTVVGMEPAMEPRSASAESDSAHTYTATVAFPPWIE